MVIDQGQEFGVQGGAEEAGGVEKGGAALERRFAGQAGE